ncbi:MAG: hypothetical protein J0M26_29390 [Planctomycetes bacterium]|nr:hypothetical protein [Planctomycetota bacterium]
MSARRPLNVCVYCGETSGLTKEHAPPKTLFARPLPSDLITVKACIRCNGAGQPDIDYFKSRLAFHPLVAGTAVAGRLAQDTAAMLARPEAAGFMRGFVSSLARDGASDFVMSVDMGRIHDVVNRMVRCLYAHEFAEILPFDHRINSLSLSTLQMMSADKVKDLQEFLEEADRYITKATSIANGDCQYMFANFPNKTGICMTRLFRLCPFVTFFSRAAATSNVDSSGS